MLTSRSKWLSWYDELFADDCGDARMFVNESEKLSKRKAHTDLRAPVMKKYERQQGAAPFNRNMLPRSTSLTFGSLSPSFAPRRVPDRTPTPASDRSDTPVQRALRSETPVPGASPKPCQTIIRPRDETQSLFADLLLQHNDVFAPESYELLPNVEVEDKRLFLLTKRI